MRPNMDKIQYGKYALDVEFDPYSDCFVGSVLNFTPPVRLFGGSPEELRDHLVFLVDTLFGGLAHHWPGKPGR